MSVPTSVPLYRSSVFEIEGLLPRFDRMFVLRYTEAIKMLTAEPCPITLSLFTTLPPIFLHRTTINNEGTSLIALICRLRCHRGILVGLGVISLLEGAIALILIRIQLRVESCLLVLVLRIVLR